MKKRLLAGLLAFVMVFGVAPLNLVIPVSAAESGTCGDNLTWTFRYDDGASNGRKTLLIYGTGDMYGYTHRAYPSDYEPWYTSPPSSVIIGNGVTSIGMNAFYSCTGLNNISIGENVTVISDSAFNRTAYYKNESNWENGVLYIGTNLIKAKPEISGDYEIRPGTTCIADKAFENCTELTSVTIPGSIKGLGNAAFSGCTGLTTVNYTGTVADWCGIHFPYVSSNPAYYGCKVYINGSELAEISEEELNGVTSINQLAFSNFTELSSVTIPDSVTSIGSSAFYGCTGLTSITIPDSVTSIGNYAFYNCTGLTEINYNAVNAADLTSSSTVFYNAGTAGEGINVTFGDSVEKIPAYLFYVSDSNYKPNIKSVTIGNSVTSIGNYAFYNCIGLTEINYNAVNAADLTSSSYVFSNAGTAGEGINVTFGDSVEKIPAYLFYVSNSSYRANIKSVTIGNSITSIGNSAFSGFTGLTSVTIGNSVTSIGNYAFYNCTGLTEINYNAVNAADLTSSSAVFYNAGTAGEGINVTFGDSVEKIPAYLFYVSDSNYKPNIKSVTIGKNVTSIADLAFSGCSGLTEINFNAKNIDLFSESQVFMNAGSTGRRIDVTFGDGVENIPAYLFYNQPYVKTVTLTNSVKTIGRYAFQDSTGLTDIYFYGTEEEWNSIRIRDYNNCLYDSDIHYLHAHSYTVSETVPATCSEYGRVTYICECGATYEEQTPKLPHTPAQAVRENEVPATCTAEGSYESVVYCSVCGEEIGRETVMVNATGHNLINHEGKASTCSEAGYAAYDTCSRCDYSTYEELPLAEHTPATEVKENTVAATCTENGSYESVVYCSVCGEELSRETVTVNATGHIPAEAVKENEIPNTNTSDGSYDSVIYCSVCGAEISRETVTVPKDTKKCGNNLTYRYDNSTKTLTISGTGEMYDNMYTTFSIYSNPLFKCKNVVIEDGATSIGQTAFMNMSTIENVSIPASVKTIGRSAFNGCSALVNVTVSDGVENIDTNAFYECSALTEIILPDSIKTVGTKAFYGCYGLKNYGGYGLKIFMPNSVENIGQDAFYGTDLFLEGTAEEWNEKFEASGGGNGAGKHYYTEVAEQSATCTLQGNTAYSYWSATNPVLYITEPVFTPATGHTPANEVRENLVAATSESTGSYDSVVYCSVCGEELSRKTTVIPKTAQNAEIFTFTADKTEAVRGSTVTFTVVASSDINMIRLVDVIDGDENNPVGMGFSKASVGSGFTDNGDGTAVWIIPLTVSLSDYTNENEANEYTLYYYDASVFSYNAADIESVCVNVTKYDNSAAVNEVGGEAVEPFSIINATADLGKKLTYTNITITTTSDVTKLRLTVDGKAVTYSAKTSNVTYTDNGDGTATWVIGYRFTKAGNYEILVESRGSSWEGCSSKTVATTIYNTAAELAAAKS